MCYISTDFVFDGEKKEPYIETDKPNPINIYGLSKLKGEQYIINNLNNFFILRLSWLYGKTGKNFVDTIISLCKEKKMQYANNDNPSWIAASNSMSLFNISFQIARLDC